MRRQRLGEAEDKVSEDAGRSLIGNDKPAPLKAQILRP